MDWILRYIKTNIYLLDGCRQREVASQEVLITDLQNTVKQLEQANKIQEKVTWLLIMFSVRHLSHNTVLLLGFFP